MTPAKWSVETWHETLLLLVAEFWVGIQERRAPTVRPGMQWALRNLSKLELHGIGPTYANQIGARILRSFVVSRSLILGEQEHSSHGGLPYDGRFYLLCRLP